MIHIKRIMTELEKLRTSNLHKNNIYYHYNDDNITCIKFLIIGPKDTPYENGFFFFYFVLPETYPFDPPKVHFKTIHSSIRFNPNLYVEGKVCLSIINTWHGPSWTSACSIHSVIISIQAFIFNNKPLTNEPGLEKTNQQNIDDYNKIIKYKTFEIAVLHVLNKNYSTFNVFYNKIIDYYQKNRDWYLNECKNLINLYHDCPTITTKFYSLNCTLNYSNLLSFFYKLNLKHIDFKLDESDHNLINE
jgi:ubiquitin-conjugating enzyme E2 Z